METEEKLMAAVMGAISAYIEMEQSSSDSVPEPKVAGERSAVKAQKA